MYQIKPVFDYLSMYEVDNEGNVWSLKGPSRHQLKPNSDNQVTLSNEHGTKGYQVSRLVAEAFIDNPNPSKLKVVLHKDGDRSNNNVTNLKWGTWLEVRSKAKGKRKITVSQDMLVSIATLPKTNFNDCEYDATVDELRSKARKMLEG